VTDCIRASKVILLLSALFLSPACPGKVTATPAGPHSGAIGLHKAGAMSRVGSRLVRAFAEQQLHASTRARTPFRPRDSFLQFRAGRIVIDAMASDDGKALLADLQNLGLLNGAHYGKAVTGEIPVAAINSAASLKSLRSIHATPRPVRNTGSITSQGDVAMRADIARSVYGVNGSGVTVGVMSDSYNSLGGAAADITSGDLPSTGVTVINGESGLCGTVIFCTDEGRAMLQIVHDVAPGADLLFHTALSSTVDFANGITALAAAGADVIVDDLLYLNEPMFQDGIVAQAVDSVAAGGVAYYSAAGNQGRNSYESAFVDSGEVFCIEIFLPLGDCHPLFERVGRLHDFDPGPGQDLYQGITIPLNATVSIAMQWNEPFGGAQTDHDIVLLDASGGLYVDISANDNVATGDGWEVLQFTNADVLGLGTDFALAITYDDVDSVAAPATLIKTVIFGSGITLSDFPTNSSTLLGHANAAGATAVGAAFFLNTPEYGTFPPALEVFSSAGGTPLLFDSSGSPLGTPVVRSKPEITAVDGVNTTFFFNDSHGNDGIDDFFGTSAAAPHAAGVAALLLEADPGASTAQINTALESTAIDMLGAGFDFDSGYGLVQADAAIMALVDPDGDGLTNVTEALLGTNPNLADTDGDGLNDFDEVNRDGNPDNYTPGIDTNPLLGDSDGDGVSDGDEVSAGTDPLDPASTPADGDINMDGIVDVVDVLLAQRALLGQITLTSSQLLHADVAPLAGGAPAPDGTFNLGDVLVIQRFALGL
jgi:subtilisin family serine protease